MCIRDRAMTIYRSGHYSMKFSKSIQRQLVEVQKDFMPEDTEAGQIQGFLEHYTGSMVCSKQLFKEALGHTYDEPKRWQLHNINEIMNTVDVYKRQGVQIQKQIVDFLVPDFQFFTFPLYLGSVCRCV